MRNLWSLVLAFGFAAGLAAPALPQTPAAPQAEARFAFVIGNDGYSEAPLPTSANDAALVADAFKAAGFDVTGARNLDSETFRASYREFLEKVAAAGPGAVAAVYLSGFGVQAEGENYLVPPGAHVARDSDLALNAVRISDLLRPLQGLQNKGKIILLDLAYAGPFAKEAQPLAPGLALVDPDNGSLIGFNAGPGEVAPAAKPPYGPYAQAIAEMIRQPGLDMNEIMIRVRGRVAELTNGAQVPWHASKLAPPLVLLERGPDAPPLEVTPEQMAERRNRPLGEMPVEQAYAAALERDTLAGYENFLKAYPNSPYARNVRGMLAARREALTWRRTLLVNTPNAYWSYLQRYAKGPHAADARRRLTRLAAALEPPPNFPPIDYDFDPPPPDEVAYFDAPQPVFYDPGVPPPPAAVYYAPPPAWWRPPPPPVFSDDEDYYLAEPEIVVAPAWVRPPAYVVAPPAPLIYEDRRPPPGASIVPYVAIPAALAAGIVAGRIISHRSDHRNPPQGLPPSAGPRPGGGPGGGPGGRPPFLPPVAAPAGALGTQPIRLQPGTGAPIRTAPVVVNGGSQQLLTQPGARPPGVPVVPPGGQQFGRQPPVPGGQNLQGRPPGQTLPGQTLPGQTLVPGRPGAPGAQTLPQVLPPGLGQPPGVRPPGGPAGQQQLQQPGRLGVPPGQNLPQVQPLPGAQQQGVRPQPGIGQQPGRPVGSGLPNTGQQLQQQQRLQQDQLRQQQLQMQQQQRAIQQQQQLQQKQQQQDQEQQRLKAQQQREQLQLQQKQLQQNQSQQRLLEQRQREQLQLQQRQQQQDQARQRIMQQQQREQEQLQRRQQQQQEQSRQQQLLQQRQQQMQQQMQRQQQQQQQQQLQMQQRIQQQQQMMQRQQIQQRQQQMQLQQRQQQQLQRACPIGRVCR